MAKGPQRSQLHLRAFAQGFDSPVYVTAPRSEPGRLYVVEQPGMIRVLVNGKLRPTPFLDIRSMVRSGGEQGLLSLAFHPRYKRNHRFFVYFNDRSGDVSVFEFRSNGAIGLRGTAKRLLRVPHREFDNHNGGQLQFGPDGRLYAGTGDGGSGGDPHNHSQNLGSRLGKLLRLNVDKRGAKWQIAGYGLRNPWRFSWDRATRDLYIADVRQGSWEKVDVRTPVQQGFLNNYGWRVWEGRSRYTSGQRTNARGKLVSRSSSTAINSAARSRAATCTEAGRCRPRAAGTSTATTAAAGPGASARCTGSCRTTGRRAVRVSSLSSWGEEAAGELYATSLDGQVYKLAP